MLFFLFAVWFSYDGRTRSSHSSLGSDLSQIETKKVFLIDEDEHEDDDAWSGRGESISEIGDVCSGFDFRGLVPMVNKLIVFHPDSGCVCVINK